MSDEVCVRRATGVNEVMKPELNEPDSQRKGP